MRCGAMRRVAWIDGDAIHMLMEWAHRLWIQNPGVVRYEAVIAEEWAAWRIARTRIAIADTNR